MSAKQEVKNKDILTQAQNRQDSGNRVPRGHVPLIPCWRGEDLSSFPVRKGLGERDLWE